MSEPRERAFPNEFDEYVWNSLEEQSREFESVINEVVRVPNSQFRRIGVPILTGLLDDTFNENQWLNYVGSQVMPVWVCEDDDPNEVIFRISPLLGALHVIMPTEDQPNITDEALALEKQLEIMPSETHRQRARFMEGVTSSIEEASAIYHENNDRKTIEVLNKIFEYYGVEGRITIPDSPSQSDTSTEAEETKVEQNANKAPAFDFSQGEDL